MTTTTTTPDIHQLSERFNRCFESFDAGDDLFADDTFFDFLPPLWRFQFQGSGSTFTDQLRSIAEGPSTVTIIRTLATESGFVTEHEERQDLGADEMVARRVWLCEVRDGRITEVTGYCNGGWDAELRARHATEAPMLR
jgi:ketosteroid isomerase-like protein